MADTLQITPENWSHFQHSLDPLTKEHYRIGDTVAKCDHCKSIFHARYREGANCPCCGRTFVAAPIRVGVINLGAGGERPQVTVVRVTNTAQQGGAAQQTPWLRRKLAALRARWNRRGQTPQPVLAAAPGVVETYIGEPDGSYHRTNDRREQVLRSAYDRLVGLPNQLGGGCEAAVLRSELPQGADLQIAAAFRRGWTPDMTQTGGVAGVRFAPLGDWPQAIRAHYAGETVNDALEMYLVAEGGRVCALRPAGN